MKKLVSLIAAMSLSACASKELPKPVIDNSHQQLVVVVANDSDAIDATLYRFEKSAGSWQQQGLYPLDQQEAFSLRP